jgi:predicted MPP superfamily phosphohydrolase
MNFAWIFAGLMLLFLCSQIYWFRKAWATVKKITPSKTVRATVNVLLLSLLLILFAVNVIFGRRPTSTRLTAYDALVQSPFAWWVASSLLAFLIAALIWLGRQAARPLVRRPISPGRRQFLERTASAVIAAPFVAGAYGLFYGRLNLQITRQPIRLARLPRAFAGFRIAQLSDIHIGPFMPEDQIRKYVEMTNGLKPDLIALTGDFLTWDPSTQRTVVNLMAALRAPFGVFGCLGNHEAWSHTEESITRLFAQVGIPILRQARTAITNGGDRINLIGVDYRTQINTPGPPSEHYVRQYLEGVETLVDRDTVNILMSHNPNTFDRAAELGIDLSLAGHTHGGQLALEFVSPEIAPSRLVTPYVAGWFSKPGGQLYVNRGIGTIGVPMRVGAPPEITVYELVSAG